MHGPRNVSRRPPLEGVGGPSISPPGWWRAMSDAIAFSELMAQIEIDPSALGEPADDDVDADLPDGDDRGVSG